MSRTGKPRYVFENDFDRLYVFDRLYTTLFHNIYLNYVVPSKLMNLWFFVVEKMLRHENESGTSIVPSFHWDPKNEFSSRNVFILSCQVENLGVVPDEGVWEWKTCRRERRDRGRSGNGCDERRTIVYNDVTYFCRQGVGGGREGLGWCLNCGDCLRNEDGNTDVIRASGVSSVRFVTAGLLFFDGGEGLQYWVYCKERGRRYIRVLVEEAWIEISNVVEADFFGVSVEQFSGRTGIFWFFR